MTNGKTVLLQLAQVDPRSLMQGDYMWLDYAITRSMPSDDEQTEHAVRIALDANSAATSVPQECLLMRLLPACFTISVD